MESNNTLPLPESNNEFNIARNQLDNLSIMLYCMLF